MRNLDITTLRSFVAVADSGGVTRAAGFLHLTQSAVSMQLKRLEDLLGAELLDRSGRGVSLTASGEQLLGYARRMVALNDEAVARLTANEYEGEISLGVPHDLVYPYIPSILRRFSADFPRMRLKLVSAPTRQLREMYGRGECDVIITTEEQPGPGGEALVHMPLVWVGAIGGMAWRRDPLPVAFCSKCIFRSGVIERIEAAGLDWEMVVDSDLDNAVEAVVSADMAIHAQIKGNLPPHSAEIDHKGVLPDPGSTRIVLYMQPSEQPVRSSLRQLIRMTYRTGAASEETELRA